MGRLELGRLRPIDVTTRKGTHAAMDAAMTWGRRHYGAEAIPASKPDCMARPDEPVIGVVVHAGAPYDDARPVILGELVNKPVFLIKQGDKYTKDCMDSLELEYLELPSNRDYWNKLAAEWREVEMHLYCDEVLHFRAPKKAVKRHRKGRTPVGA